MNLDEINIIIAKDGMPCIVLPPILPNVQIKFFNYPVFTEIQEHKEQKNFKDILDELKKLFRG